MIFNYFQIITLDTAQEFVGMEPKNCKNLLFKGKFRHTDKVFMSSSGF